MKGCLKETFEQWDTSTLEDEDTDASPSKLRLDVGDSETKLFAFKTVLAKLFRNFCPLARGKRPLAQPWISRRIIVMQKHKKAAPNSTGTATSTTTGFTPGHCGVPGQFTKTTSSGLPSVTQKSPSCILMKGQRRETLSPGRGGRMVPL